MMAAWPYLLAAVAVVVSAQVFLRRSMRTDRTDVTVVGTLGRALRSPSAWIGNLGQVLAMMIWLKVLSLAEIGLAYPVFIGASVVGVMLASRVILGERVPLRRVAGTALMLAGIVAASME